VPCSGVFPTRDCSLVHVYVACGCSECAVGVLRCLPGKNKRSLASLTTLNIYRPTCRADALRFRRLAPGPAHGRVPASASSWAYGIVQLKTMPSLTSSRVKQAARNNAQWCDAVCRVHGASGEFHQTVWLNRHAVPRFYPNVVTLSGRDAAPSQYSCIEGLAANGPRGGWTVKDSFGTLELATLHFDVLFEATWLWRVPSKALPIRRDSRLLWTTIREAHQLTDWEAAWNGDSTSESFHRQPRVFLPTLLTDPAIAFIAAWHGQELVGGAVANQSDDVVGLSNVLVPRGEHAVSFWTACVAMIRSRFPGAPIVTYARKPELAIAQEVGFAPLQAMRVWTRQA
jgi:hypothetical protein